MISEHIITSRISGKTVKIMQYAREAENDDSLRRSFHGQVPAERKNKRLSES